MLSSYACKLEAVACPRAESILQVAAQDVPSAHVRTCLDLCLLASFANESRPGTAGTHRKNCRKDLKFTEMVPLLVVSCLVALLAASPGRCIDVFPDGFVTQGDPVPTDGVRITALGTGDAAAF